MKKTLILCSILILATIGYADLVSIKILADEQAGAGDYAFIDDIHVVPEPFVISLICLTGVAFIAIRRWFKVE